MTISNGWAFQWVENQETIKFFNFISPLLKLPNQKTLADEILKNSAKRIQNNIEAAAKDDKYGVSISLDGWKNVVKQNILGLVITRSDGQVLIWEQKILTGIVEILMQHFFALFCAPGKSLCSKCPQIITKKLLETSKNTTAIVKYFNASSKFTKDLRDEQKRIYNKYITLIQPDQTRWNSYYFCYQSVFKNKRILKSLAGRNDFSDVTVVHEKEEGNNNNKLMASKIISIIDNPDFWINLVELKKIFYPYCATLNLLQKDKARLYDVLYSFGYFMQCTSECDDDDYREMMTRRLERRWKTWKQPLLILSFFLHPSYKLQFFASDSKLSHINLNKWVQYYYIKWFELEQTPLDYWSFLSDSVPELSQIATKLFSICVNSASCEWLFSTMDFLHTKRRNKLHYSKVLWMAQIHGELQREKFIKSIILDDQLVNNNRIAVPVGDEEIDESIMEPPELDVDDIDDKSDNGDDDEVDKFIKLWFEGLNEEDISEDDTPDNKINENLNELLSTQIHSADNNDAKWDLTTLFKSQLVAPSFFSNMSL
ncbi:unnamed protein product [Rhizophagus irregularis]|nr:unnamed protein product [Rhizophagus irregularis]